MNKRTYLVTGDAGFIGSHLTSRLIRDGHFVYVVDNLSTGRIDNRGWMYDRDGGLVDNFSFVSPHDRGSSWKGDITDEGFWEDAGCLEDVDVIFHQAALPSVARSVEEPQRITEVNVNGTLSLLEAASEAGVKRLVFASSSSVYGNQSNFCKREHMCLRPGSPYAASKASGEHYCRAYKALGKIETVCLRYFNVFGPRQDPYSDYAAVIPTFIRQMLGKTEAYTVNGDGGQSRDFTYVDNVVEANLLAAGALSEHLRYDVYNIGCGRRHTLEDLMDEIDSYNDGPEMGREYGPEREGDVRHSLSDTTRAQEDLGFFPVIDFQEGVRRTVESLEYIADIEE